MKLIRQSHHFDRGLFSTGNDTPKKARFVPIVCVSAGHEGGIESARVIKLQARTTCEEAERAAYEAFRATLGAVAFTVEEVTVD